MRSPWAGPEDLDPFAPIVESGYSPSDDERDFEEENWQRENAREEAQAEMTASTVSVEIPYGLAASDLKLDAREEADTWETLLDQLAADFGTDEAKRVLCSAVCLLTAGAGTLAQCLDTAMTWERG